MNSESGRSGRKDHGPQGTQVFSRDEVSELINDAAGQQSAASRAELTGLSGSVSGQSFALVSTRMIVGRADNCDLQIDDASVSSEHARLVHDAGGWRVVNLLSTNGTFVNETKVSSSAITSGDRIRFGRVDFRFYDPDESKSANGGAARWLPWVAAIGSVAVIAAVVIWAL